MSGDFEDRLRRAAQQHAKGAEANERAEQAQATNSKDFLLGFHDVAMNTIEPAFDQAEQHVEAAGKVKASTQRSDDEDRISLTLSCGKKFSLLVFRADPVRLRVFLHQDFIPVDWEDPSTISRMRDVEEGRGSPIAELTLDQLTSEAVEGYVLAFVERALL